MTISSDDTVTEYLDGFQYKDGSISFFPHAEGYVNVIPCSECIVKYRFNYVFNYLDHLGNIRMSYTTDPEDAQQLSILDENHYYPFGLKHTNYNAGSKEFQKKEGSPELTELEEVVDYDDRVYKYKYNGKEYQDELGLNMYDYGARFYDPALGRFWQVDPVAEQSRRFSTYSYALNNPVYFIDRDGMFADVRENDEDSGPPNPFDKSPKETKPEGEKFDNFTPSDKTMSLLNEGKDLLKNVFGYEATGSAGYALGVSGTVGPVKAEGELTVVEISAGTNEKNLVEGQAKGAGAKASIGLGDAKAEVKASTGSAKIEVDKKLNVKTSSEGATASGTVSKGKLSLSNSGTLGASVKIPTPEGVTFKVGASVNLYNAAKGAYKMLQGGASYLSDYVTNWWSGN